MEFTPSRWAPALRGWLELRKRLWREFRIPVTRELHMTECAQGLGRISTRVPDRHLHDGVPYWKGIVVRSRQHLAELGRRVAERQAYGWLGGFARCSVR